MKRVLLLSSALLLGVILAPIASARGQQADDPAIGYVLTQAILLRSQDGEFHGNGLVTRLDFVLATVNAVYGDTGSEACFRNIAPSQPAAFRRLFSDVERTDWYAKGLCVALHAGLIRGYPDGSFRPFASITTAEAAVIAARAYGLAYGSDAGTAWYAASMSTLAARGAVARGTLPHSPLTRRNMATMFYALRNHRLTRTPARTPAAETDAAPTSSPPASSTTEPVPAAQPARTDQPEGDICISALTGPGSPGTALMVLGQPPLVRTIDRHSRRVLRENVEAAYQQGTFPQHDQTTNRCRDALGARSPGAALLLTGLQAHPRTITDRIPNRVLQQKTYEARGRVPGM